MEQVGIRTLFLGLAVGGICIVLSGCFPGSGGKSGLGFTGLAYSAEQARDALAAGGAFPGETVKNSLTSYASADVSKERIHAKKSSVLAAVRSTTLAGAVHASVSNLDYENPNCLTCHSKPADVSDADYRAMNAYYQGDILSESSRDANIAMAHVKMLPYISGMTPESVFPQKASSNQCRVCHQSVDTSKDGSGGGLRKNVNVEICASPSCHGQGTQYTNAEYYQE